MADAAGPAAAAACASEPGRHFHHKAVAASSFDGMRCRSIYVYCVRVSSLTSLFLWRPWVFFLCQTALPRSVEGQKILYLGRFYFLGLSKVQSREGKIPLVSSLVAWQKSSCQSLMEKAGPRRKKQTSLQMGAHLLCVCVAVVLV